jgi:hypothetical protein
VDSLAPPINARARAVGMAGVCLALATIA